MTQNYKNRGPHKSVLKGQYRTFLRYVQQVKSDQNKIIIKPTGNISDNMNDRKQTIQHAVGKNAQTFNF